MNDYEDDGVRDYPERRDPEPDSDVFVRLMLACIGSFLSGIAFAQFVWN